MKIKILILTLLFCSLFVLSKQSANAYAICSTGDTSHAYTSKDYYCDDLIGCRYRNTTRYGNCDTFSASTQYWENGGMCGFCGVADETCTDELRRDGFGELFYQCTYGKTYKPNGNYCQYAKFISCGPPAAPCKTIDCTNKCGLWDRGTGCSDKDCGKCSTGYSCNKTTQKCDKVPSCVPDPASFADCGDNYLCGTQNNGCGGTFNCGSNCDSGYTCQGQNSNGRDGTCRISNPSPTPNTSNTVTAMVFYDKYGTSTNKKGTEPSYTNCYPATNTTGSGATSASVSLVVDNASGRVSENYTKTSYKNCFANGSSGAKGFILNSAINCKSVKLNVPAGYSATGYNYSVAGGNTTIVTTGQLDRTPILCGNATVRFGVEKVVPPTRVSGTVYVDDNGNNQFDPGSTDATGNNEACYGGTVNMVVGGVAKSYSSTKGCASFSFTKGAGSETVTLNAISKYTIVGLQYKDATHPNWTSVENTSNAANFGTPINGNGEIRYAIKTAPSTFSIGGAIFTDDKTPYKTKGSTENNYCGGTNANRTITVYDSVTGLQVGQANQKDAASGQCGSGYLISGLDPGNYKVVYTSLPSDYNMTYPVNNPPPDPSFYVTIGDNCSTIDYNSDQTQGTGDRHAQAVCTIGDISNLNFGIIPANQEPWFQSIGGDVRSDTNNISRVSSSATCNGTTTPYLSSSTTTLDSGVVFSAKLTDLAGSADRSNIRKWLVLGNKFDPVRPATIRTSYNYLNNVLTKGGATITTALWQNGGICNGSKPSCTLPTNGNDFPSGVYKAVASGTENGLKFPPGPDYTFPANRNYIFLVEGGDLKIEKNLIVPTTTTVIFTTQKSIKIEDDVTRIDGMFSADDDFRVFTNGVSNIYDPTLTVNGNVITNAAQKNEDPGTFENERDLGPINNALCPSVTVKSRPDFILNAPATIRYPNYIIQEVAPGGNDIVAPTSTPTPTPTATPTPTPTPTPGYREVNGTVVIEGESTRSIAYPSTNSWSIGPTDSGASSNTYIRTIPNNGINFTPPNSARLDYPVWFSGGTYKVWLRGYAPDGTSNSISVSIDGATPTLNPVNFTTVGAWVWDNTDVNGVVTTLTIPAGFHYVSIWEKKDGTRLDEFELTKGSTTPSGEIAESPYN